MKDHKITMLMILFFFIGLLVFFYPTLSNYYNEKNQSRTIYNYENILKNTNQIDFGKVKNDAIEYNKKLSKLKEPLLTYDTLKNYKKLLNINNDGMMGYLTIDKIKVELPIYHTVSETVLNSSVGHLEGTSLPIGGKSTHCVLTGHTGLSKAEFFTRLNELIAESPLVKQAVVSTTKNPAKIEFANGSMILGFTTGDDAASIRGQRAD